MNNIAFTFWVTIVHFVDINLCEGDTSLISEDDDIFPGEGPPQQVSGSLRGTMKTTALKHPFYL